MTNLAPATNGWGFLLRPLQQLRRLGDVDRDAYDRAPPILKLGTLAMLEATRRASSSSASSLKCGGRALPRSRRMRVRGRCCPSR